MDTTNALESFSALAQPTRLAVFRLLVREEPRGLAAGELARQLEVPHNTLSSHLAILARAGWVISSRDGRSIIYRANLDHMKQVVQFLIVDCCAGHPQVCGPDLANLFACSPHSSTSDAPCHQNRSAGESKKHTSNTTSH